MPVIDEFVMCFNRIEDYLQTQYAQKKDAQAKEDKAKGHPGFVTILYDVAKVDPAVAVYKHDLKRLASLRNIIVHGEGIEEMSGIARPTDTALKRIRQIDRALRQPPLAIELANKPVTTCSDNATLGEISRLMRRHAYSQIPVLKDGTFAELLTNNMIVRWLGQLGAKRSIVLDDIHVKAVIHLPTKEDSTSYRFLSLAHTVFDVAAAFEPQLRGATINTVLFTKTGASTEPLEGIITAADLPKVYDARDRAGL